MTKIDEANDFRIRVLLGELSQLDETFAISRRDDLRRQLYAEEEDAREARRHHPTTPRQHELQDSISARVTTTRTMLALAERAVQAHAEARARKEQERGPRFARAYLRITARTERAPKKRSRAK